MNDNGKHNFKSFFCSIIHKWSHVYWISLDKRCIPGTIYLMLLLVKHVYQCSLSPVFQIETIRFPSKTIHTFIVYNYSGTFLVKFCWIICEIILKYKELHALILPYSILQNSNLNKPFLNSIVNHNKSVY